MIDAGVGADKAKFVFDDDRSRPCAQHFIAFAKNELNKPWILFGLRRELNRPLRWRDGYKVDCASFGFGDDLLGKDQNIIVFKRDPGFFK